MSLIDQLRASRPDLEELKDLTDSDLVSMYSQVTGASLDLSAMDLGLDPQDYIQNKGRGEDLVNQGILGLGDIVGGTAGFLDLFTAGLTGYAPLSSAVDWAADATGLSEAITGDDWNSLCRRRASRPMLPGTKPGTMRRWAPGIRRRTLLE